ncbi:MAG TPA: hypothetical protein VMD57_00775, partial [Candidatus Baltobacteraceae bacterium]|nr:hypothetical protein [Candidatus Baltobacteraceae bacterium]
PKRRRFHGIEYEKYPVGQSYAAGIGNPQNSAFPLRQNHAKAGRISGDIAAIQKRKNWLVAPS